jgi:flagellar basal body-associated protein FliL
MIIIMIITVILMMTIIIILIIIIMMSSYCKYKREQNKYGLLQIQEGNTNKTQEKQNK